MSFDFNPAREREYIQRISEGDTEAFHAIYYHYSPRILAKLIRVLKSEELASDILQDLFSIIWQKRAEIDPDRSFGAFLFKISDNLVIDLFRKTKRDQELADKLLKASTESQESIEQWLFQKENNAWLTSAIEHLPPQRRLVFKLCKLEQKSHEEVSLLLNISRATVNNHLVKATQSLREMAARRSDLAGVLFVAWLFG
jgi:RNA polymerase sigma-70 factor (ECF subfamily)